MIILRDLEETDRDLLFHWRNLPEIMQWMYTDHEITRSEHDGWFTSILDDPAKKYWIIELDSSPVGVANLSQIDFGQLRCTWAFYLASEHVRGRGVGAVVEYRVLDYVFHELKLDRIWCEVLEHNTNVISMHQRFGFQVEGTLRDHVIKGGRRIGVVSLGLLRNEWVSIHESVRSSLLERGLL